MITKITIPAAMKAVVLEAPRRLALREIPVWPIDSYGDPDLVLVQVEACGVCGSDFRYYAGENPWAMHTLGRHVDNPPGIVLGHEYAGEVVAVADPQNEPLLGKRVAPVCSKVCGKCPDCRAGRTQLCPNTVHMGHGQGWGKRDFYPGAYARICAGLGQRLLRHPGPFELRGSGDDGHPGCLRPRRPPGPSPTGSPHPDDGRGPGRERHRSGRADPRRQPGRGHGHRGPSPRNGQKGGN